MHSSEIRDRLTGPVASMRTPFDRDGDIDYPSVGRLIDAAIAGGSKTIMLTAGDSHFETLSDGEIADLTRATVAHTAGRAMVIAADRYHATARAVDFATFAREAGADMVMCLPPDWGQSSTPRNLAEHYAAVARVLPVMIVTNRFIPRGEGFGLETLERALDASPGIVAIKDDMCGVFAQKICARFGERCAIISGGQKRNHLSCHPYGCHGYLSTFVYCRTDVTRRYWTAIRDNDLAGAARIVSEQDGAFFDYVTTQVGRFDACIHGMLALNGLMQRYRRLPYHTLDDAQMADLERFLRERGLLND